MTFDFLSLNEGFSSSSSPVVRKLNYGLHVREEDEVALDKCRRDR